MKLKKIKALAGIAAALISFTAIAPASAQTAPCGNGDPQCRIGAPTTYEPNYGVSSPKGAQAKPMKNTLKYGDTYTGEPGVRTYKSPAGQAIARGATTNKYGTIAKENRTYSYIFNEPDPEVIGNVKEAPASVYKPRYTKP